MSVQKTGDIRRKVTSVGNSWIVCNSRSHPGLVYYFNTLTGEAVWNLSNAEIEKAKQRTKELETQSGAKPTKCPEPIQPPSSNLLNNLQPPDIRYINPFIVNTSSSSQQIAPFATPNEMLAQQISQINSPAVNVINNLESLNSSISTLNVQTTSIYNPKVWAVPHTQQVFIAPPPNPLGNHVNGSGNGPFNNFNQNVTQTMGFKNFGSTSQEYNATRVANQTYPRHYNYIGQGGMHHLSKNKQFNSLRKDLRQKLFVRKRVHSLSTETGIENKRMFGNSGDNIAEENEEINEHDQLNSFEKRSPEIQMHESPSKMDLTPLKILVPIDTKTEDWFIVTDFNVLVSEYKFITALTDSDEQCHLMVPRRVMSQLREYVSSTADKQARRILRFLPQQIESAYAFMAEEPLHDERDSTSEVILTTCVTLAENNYHVVLISNDTELLAYKNSDKVNIFSVEEVKKILEKSSNQVISSKKSFMFDRLIKITVPNDTKQVNDIASSVELIQPNNENEKEYKTELIVDKIIDKPEETEVLKRTVDAAIQTDFEIVKAVPSVVNDVEKTILTAKNTKEVSDCPPVSVRNVVNNKRKIKLNRSISHQNPLPAVESNVKQFKWRRRRNTTQVNTQTTTQCIQNTQPKTPELLDINTFNKVFNKQADTVLNVSQKVAQNQFNRNLSKQAGTFLNDSPKVAQFQFNRDLNKEAEKILNESPKVAQNQFNRNLSKQAETFLNDSPKVAQFQFNRDLNKEAEKILNESPKVAQNQFNRNLSKQAETFLNDSPKVAQFQFNRDLNKEAEKILNESPKVAQNQFNRDSNTQVETVLNESPKIAQNQTKFSDDSINSKDSSICIVKHKKKNNVTIEETSTSDIISNTESNVDSEGNYSNTFVDQHMVHKNYERPMYEIDGKSMEDYLIMNSDEWVSRFIQIMEEVLTQVLQQEPPFSHREMPPPWTLHEAAQCIAIKFRSNREITEIANTLSSMLFHISDSKGIIAVHIKPCEYMQIYSYGVHLIDALSKEIKSCEDLQIAAGSLKKLLEDIKNLNADTSTNDTFNESSTKKSSTETSHNNISDIEVDNPSDEKESLSEQSEHDLIDGPEATQINTPKEKTSPVKFIRNIDLKTSFFSNLKLKSVNTFQNDYFKPQEDSHKKLMPIDSHIEKERTKNLHTASQPVVTKESANINAVDNQQKVIRNFSICAEFEERFKSKKLDKMFEEHDDELDYEEDYDEGEYLMDPQDDANSFSADILETDEISQSAKPDILNNDLNIESSKKFKYVTYMLLKEIRTAVNQVRIFCDQYYEELQKPDLSKMQKREKIKMAETAHLHMERLCKSLARMADQGEDGTDEKLCRILKQAGVNISHIDEDMIFQYRNAVSKSIDYAKTFLNEIADVICAFKS